MKTISYVIGFLIGALGMMALLSFIEGAIVMWLWNWLAVTLLEASVITYWTGWGVAFALNFIAWFFKMQITVKKN